MSGLTLTWLGHAAFRVDTPSGKRIYVDPWLGNPKCPEAEQEPERVDLIVLTHGHDDHVGNDGRARAEVLGCPVVRGGRAARLALHARASPRTRRRRMNKGGTAHVDGVSITFTDAKHSSSALGGRQAVYLGEPAGIVLGVEDAATIYFAGDTCVFGDMSLIGRIYEPDLAVLPIGDHYTMGPKEAAVAARAPRREAHGAVPLGHVRPPHGNARGVPRAHVRTARSSRSSPASRWRSDGARALVRRDRGAGSGDRGRGRRAGSARRTPWSSRASSRSRCSARPTSAERRWSCAAPTPRRCALALARPEVACVLVPADRAELLELDLRRLTYG